MKWSSPLLFLIAAGVPSARSHDDVYSIDGSGTTNPSKCIWLHMQNFMERSKKPLHLTYRAVGSSTGQMEFLGVNNTGPNGTDAPFSYVPYNDFGSGDIPLSTENYDALKEKGIEMVHLPFVLGAISLFHNIPGVPDGPGGLNLTSCLIAKIFKREIVHWDDDEILEKNENLKNILPSDNYPIKVARRVHGSSSTASVTEYLHVGCPAEWPKSMVGKTIDWVSDTMECEGSGGMSTCIRDNEGAIGYIDAGHGHEERLVEIELENADGTFLSSRRAAQEGGIGDAAGGIPGRADADFGAVKLLNKPGMNTWPIVAMSYFYVRKDLSFLDSPEEQSLLKTFLNSTFFDEDEIEQCKQFGFTPVPKGIRDVALEGINMLQVADGAPEWWVEKDTVPGMGQGDWVISHKRRSYAEYERSTMDSQITGEGAKVASLQQSTSQIASTMGSQRVYTDDDAQKLNIALGLAAASFALWVLTLVAFGVKQCK